MNYLSWNGRGSWTAQPQSQVKKSEDAAAPMCRQTWKSDIRQRSYQNPSCANTSLKPSSPQVRYKSNQVCYSLFLTRTELIFSHLAVNKDQVISAPSFSGDIRQTGFKDLEHRYTYPNMKDVVARQSSQVTHLCYYKCVTWLECLGDKLNPNVLSLMVHPCCYYIS